MSTNIANKTPYLLTSRIFPIEPEQLSINLGKTYIDIANNVNARTIGIFATGRPIINGESWFTQGGNQKQEVLRQLYTFTAAGTITHNIDTSNIGGFVKIYGTFTDGTVWYSLPYVSETADTNQVSLTVDATNINVTAGGGSPPSITSGFVVLEWLSVT